MDSRFLFAKLRAVLPIGKTAYFLTAAVVTTATTTIVSTYAVIATAEEEKKDYDNPSAVSTEKVITHISLPPFFYITYYAEYAKNATPMI